MTGSHKNTCGFKIQWKICPNGQSHVSVRISLFSQAGFQHVPLSVPKTPTIIEGAKLVAKYISNIVSMSVHQKFQRR